MPQLVRAVLLMLPADSVATAATALFRAQRAPVAPLTLHLPRGASSQRRMRKTSLYRPTVGSQTTSSLLAAMEVLQPERLRQPVVPGATVPCLLPVASEELSPSRPHKACLLVALLQ